MKKAIKQVEDLEVFRKAYRLSLELHEKCSRFPKHEQFHGVADQLRRASKGVCANLAEGFGKQAYSKAEFKRYIAMAIGSADGARLWLSYSRDLGYLPRKEAETHRERYRAIAKMLTGLYKIWG